MTKNDCIETPCDLCELPRKVGIDFEYKDILFCPLINLVFTDYSEPEEIKNSFGQEEVKKPRKRNKPYVDVKSINLL